MKTESYWTNLWAEQHWTGWLRINRKHRSSRRCRKRRRRGGGRPEEDEEDDEEDDQVYGGGAEGKAGQCGPWPRSWVWPCRRSRRWATSGASLAAVPLDAIATAQPSCTFASPRPERSHWSVPTRSRAAESNEKRRLSSFELKEGPATATATATAASAGAYESLHLCRLCSDMAGAVVQRVKMSETTLGKAKARQRSEEERPRRRRSAGCRRRCHGRRRRPAARVGGGLRGFQHGAAQQRTEEEEEEEEEEKGTLPFRSSGGGGGGS